MSKSHNKRRNAALMYEFLVRKISSSLIDDDQHGARQALKLLKRHFKPNTELHREFRLMNSLVKTTVSSEAVAASILQEAKRAARTHDIGTLDKEKSTLINVVNKRLNDATFYDQQIDEYKTYATIQTLLNEWRSESPDISLMAKYEDHVMKWLTTDKVVQSQTISEGSNGSNRLLISVMMKKLNEKYAGSLSNAQKSLVRSYALSAAKDDVGSLKRSLTEVRDGLLTTIAEFKTTEEGQGFLKAKLDDIEQKLTNESLESIDDDTVSRFMLYVKLGDELTEE